MEQSAIQQQIFRSRGNNSAAYSRRSGGLVAQTEILERVNGTLCAGLGITSWSSFLTGRWDFPVDCRGRELLSDFADGPKVYVNTIGAGLFDGNVYLVDSSNVDPRLQVYANCEGKPGSSACPILKVFVGTPAERAEDIDLEEFLDPPKFGASHLAITEIDGIVVLAYLDVRLRYWLLFHPILKSPITFFRKLVPAPVGFAGVIPFDAVCHCGGAPTSKAACLPGCGATRCAGSYSDVGFRWALMPSLAWQRFGGHAWLAAALPYSVKLPDGTFQVRFSVYSFDLGPFGGAYWNNLRLVQVADWIPAVGSHAPFPAVSASLVPDGDTLFVANYWQNAGPCATILMSTAWTHDFRFQHGAWNLDSGRFAMKPETIRTLVTPPLPPTFMGDYITASVTNGTADVASSEIFGAAWVQPTEVPGQCQEATWLDVYSNAVKDPRSPTLCPAGFNGCGGQCLPDDDQANCGGCGVNCGAPQLAVTCQGGRCVSRARQGLPSP